MKQLRILHMFAGEKRKWTGCDIYRTIIPVQEIYKHGHIAHYDWFESFTDLAKRKSVEHAIDQLIAGYDIFVFPRLAAVNTDIVEVIYHFFYVLRGLGKTIVFEVDDDYTNEHRLVLEGHMLEFAKWSDVITVTTPYLANLMRKTTGRPTYILPNCLPPHVWKDGTAPERLKYHDDLLIGLTGSTTHVDDWRVVEQPLLDILEKNDNVRLLTMGYCPEPLLDHEKVTYLKWSDYSAYSQVIRGCDIILTPVIPDDKFNLSKSPIKAVEGQGAERKVAGISAGAAVISTDNPVYRLAIKPGENGLLVQHTEQAWYDAIQTLIDKPDTRHELQKRGYKSAWKRFDATREWREWVKVYNIAATQTIPPKMSIKGLIHDA